MLLAPGEQRPITARPATWMPDYMVQQSWRYGTQFSKAERQAMRKKTWEKPSQWAPKGRKIIKGRLAGNYMSMDVTPHLRGIMDAAVLPYIRWVTIYTAPQTAKTTGIDTLIAWTRIFAKGPAVSFYPDEVTGKRSMRERIAPMVRQSPGLARQVLPGRDSYSQTGIDMAGGSWEVGWVGSVAQTADRSLRYMDAQEVNKPGYGKITDETGVLELLRKRVRAYGDLGKGFFTSSPTTVEGNITRLLEHETEAVFIQWVHCPHCHQEIRMVFSRDTFWWPKGDDGHSLDRKLILSQKLARYVCQVCGTMWTDHDRDIAIRREVWRLRLLDDKGNVLDEKGEELFRYCSQHRPASIGFIMPSWYSYFVSLSEVAHDFLRAQDKSISPEERLNAQKDFKNGHEAEPWQPKVVEREEDALKALKGDRPQGYVPAQGVAALVAGVDTQGDGNSNDGFWFWIMAVGYGRAPRRWLVRTGFVFTFEALTQVLWQSEYRDTQGNIYPVQYVLQDAMGHRTSDVYDFCATASNIILPTKGEQTMATPYATSDVEFYPGPEKRKFPGALKRVRVNTTYYKDKMDGILKVRHEDPGSLDFPADMSDGDLRQLCAETRNEKGFWEQIGSRDNHLWDCFSLALCAEDLLGCRYWPDPGLQTSQEDEEEQDVLISSFMQR